MTGISANLLQRRVLNGHPALQNGDGSAIIGQHQLDQSKINQFDRAVGRNFNV